MASPRQDRSRRTLARIVTAAGQMLEDGTFEHAAVHQIVRRARSSIGSFYARFPHKEALLDHLVAQVHDAMLARIARLRQDRRWQRAGLGDRFDAYVGVAAAWTRAHRGVLRARLLHHLTLGGAVPRDQIEKSRRLVDEARAFLAAAIGRGTPARALGDALQLVDAMIGTRYLITGPGLDSFPRHSERAFRQNVVRAALCLIGRRHRSSRKVRKQPPSG